MATIFDLCSECMMILLVLLLANGWYTRFKEINPINAVEHVFTYFPIFFMVIVIEVLIVALSEMDKNAQHKYHDFHGWMGFAIIATKLSLIALFYYFYSNCVDKIRQDSKQFYRQITILGLCYLLSDPFAILSSYLLEEYNREFYFNISDHVMHIFL